MAKRTMGLVVAAVLLFGAGVAVGGYVLGDAGDRPCWQVERDVQQARDTLAETFGGGDEGQAAMDELAAAAADHPNCFSPQDRESISKMAEIEPSTGGTDDAAPTAPSESVSGP